MSQGGQAAWLLLALIAGACGSSSPPPAPAAESAKSTATHDIDRASMDTSVAPGDDFYRYANGTWLKSTEIPADRGSYGVFDVLFEQSQQRT